MYKEILGEESIVDIVVDILGAESKFPGVQLNCMQILRKFVRFMSKQCTAGSSGALTCGSRSK